MTEIERLTDEMKELAERTAEVTYMVEVIEETIRGIEESTVTHALCPKEIEAYLKLWKDREELEEIIDGFNFEIRERIEKIREAEHTEGEK